MNADAALSSKIKFGSTGVIAKLVHISSQSSAVSRARNCFAYVRALECDVDNQPFLLTIVLFVM